MKRPSEFKHEHYAILRSLVVQRIFWAIKCHERVVQLFGNLENKHMGQRGKQNSLTTVEAILANEIRENQKAGRPCDDLTVISERLRLAKLDDKSSFASRTGLAVGICASALLLSGSALPENTVPIAPTIQIHGSTPATRY
ncbi:MAG TPA: hypothetical protein VF733_00175 [Candidatus Saccharimonadales bacterium]